jgi:hypothetical protein
MSPKPFLAPALLVVMMLPQEAHGELYGLAMVHNGPVQDKLVRISSVTGNMTYLGAPLGPDNGAMTGSDDLRAVDEKRGIYYFLGDTHAGATLVGLQLADGAQVCGGAVPVKEVGFVGLGQSLTYDYKSDELVLTGLAANSTGGLTHQILRGALSPDSWSSADRGASTPCAKFKKAGTFWFSSSSSMIHSSALDVENQMLYSTVMADKTQFALAVIDLSAQTLTSVEIEAERILDGMSWDPATKRLIGLMPGAQTKHPPSSKLSLVSLDPATGKFDPLRDLVLDAAGPGVWVLDGNEGQVHSYDPVSGLFYALLSTPMIHPGDVLQHTVATIDWKVSGTPRITS